MFSGRHSFPTSTRAGSILSNEIGPSVSVVPFGSSPGMMNGSDITCFATSSFDSKRTSTSRHSGPSHGLSPPKFRHGSRVCATATGTCTSRSAFAKNLRR